MITLPVMNESKPESYMEAESARQAGEFERALEIYESLSKRGDVYSLVMLGDMYARGLGTSVDLEMAEKLFDRAESLGVPEAALQKAGIWFDRGDMHKYFLAVQQAARKGLLVAQFYLGLCYARGRGVQRNENRALELIQDAAQRGHLGAKAFLARRMLRRPYNLFGFVRGLILLFATIGQVIVLSLRNGDDERLR